VLAFKDFLSDIQHGMQKVSPTFKSLTPNTDYSKNEPKSTSAFSLPISKLSKERESQEGYILGGFIVGSTSFPDEMSESLRNHFIHNIRIPSIVPLNEYPSTIRWLIETANVRASSDFDLTAWVEKSCHGVRRNFGDLRACLAYTVR